MSDKLEIIEEFSKIDGRNKRRYYVKFKCVCGNLFSTRKDSPAGSCGCINANKNTTRKIGKFLYLAEERVEKSKLASARTVYRTYSDGDISFEKFLELSQLPCYYCGKLLSNSLNQGLKKDGTIRTIKKVNSDGHGYYRNGTYSDLGYEATFFYNGSDRKNPKGLHNLDNIVVCCKTCNFMKRDMSTEEFINHIKRMYLCLIIQMN